MFRILTTGSVAKLTVEYWYITLTVLIIAIIVLIAIGYLLFKARQVIKENQEVQKGRKKENEEKLRRAKMLAQKQIAQNDVAVAEEEGEFPLPKA